MISAGIITISDKGAAGRREDLSGPAIRDMLASLPAEVTCYEIIPDEKDLISDRLIHFADSLGLDLILTSGGTGVGERDFTPEATLAVIDKQIPGMAEVMRMESLKKTPHAMISRAVVGVRGRSLIVNLPGSPKAVRENLAAILPAIPHAVAKIKGDQGECAQPQP
jgi:molybdenum cofactor synthesis domain-containing protein